jgi:uncharacterized RDD family membrane protein YckC
MHNNIIQNHEEHKMLYCHECGGECESDKNICEKCGNVSENLKDIIGNELANTDEINKSIKTKRIAAGMIDWLIAVVFFFVASASRIHFAFGRIWIKVAVVLIICAYLAFKDSCDGKSIGKLFMGLTVVNKETKEPIGFIDSFNRNWFLGIPIIGLTVFSLIIFIQILLSKTRLGEKTSQTEVIDDIQIGDL